MQVQTTAGSREEAAAIADVLLTGRLAACVQVVGPVESRYWWRGRLESAEEWLCVAKTTRARVDTVTDAVVAAHRYETPEVVVTPIEGGSDAYLRWIEDEVGQP